MSWKKVKLGEILKRRRETIKVFPDKEYKLVTIKLYHKGVVLRSLSQGVEIKSPMSMIKAGDFILSGIDARNGAFGIVPEELDGAIITNDFWCLDPDENLIDKEFLLFLTSTEFFDYICKQSSDGTTQRIRLQKDRFFNYEINLPSLETQKVILQKLKNLKFGSELLSTELTHQLNLVQKLRQQLLQEAVQGKLVPQDPSDEPAGILLQKIKAEKERLVKEKKIKKDKDLPEIKAEEIPFEIPEGWVWCRLGEIALFSEAGKSYKCIEVPISGEEWGVVKVSAVSWDVFLQDQNKLYSPLKPDDISAQIKSGDFLISRANTAELIGKSVVVRNISKNLLLSDKTIRFRFSSLVSTEFVNLCNNSKISRKYYASMGSGSSPSMKNITRDHMNNLVVPLPPLAEQHRIVQKLEQLLQVCDALQASIQESRGYNEQLLQQVLREALKGE